MANANSPEAVVQRQLEAYNARDLQAWLATFAEDARQFEHPDTLLAAGHAEIRTRAVARFADPNLNARLIRRSVLGNVVVDHEAFHRTFPEGPGTMDLVCIYVVTDGLIRSASFVSGPLVLDRK